MSFGPSLVLSLCLPVDFCYFVMWSLSLSLSLVVSFVICLVPPFFLYVFRAFVRSGFLYLVSSLVLDI